MQISSIQPIDRTLSGATTPDQCGPGNDGNEEEFHIPQSSCVNGTSPSDCLVSYLGHSLGIVPLYKEVVGVFSGQYPELNVKTVLFQIIQFRHKYMSKQFYFEQFSLA